MDLETNKIIIDTILPYNPKEIAVFGSYARGEMRPDSDIDIMIDVRKDVTLLDLGGVYMELVEKLNRNVDLVTKGGVHTILKKYIERDLISIYREV